MVRGPNSGNVTRSSVYYIGTEGLASPLPRAGTLSREIDLLASEVPPWDCPPSDSGPGGAWSGAGGRWLLWPLRAVLWATLLIIAFRGVTAIVFREAPASTGGGVGAAGAVGGQFPTTLAEAYAADFGRVYLNFSPQTQGQREQELAAFVPTSVAAANPDLGWNGSGQMSLQSEQVAGITVQDRQHAVVTLLASVNSQLMELGVPIVASGGGVAVSGEPAWLPAPPRISLPSPSPRTSDPVAQRQLMNELPAFFQAYANSDNATLNRFLAPGVSLTGLGGTVAFDSVAGLHVPSGGMTRQISVAVIWLLPDQAGSSAANLGMASKLELTYRMSVVDLQSGKWYVKEIGASTEAVGAR
jgi:hypothetical protein